MKKDHDESQIVAAFIMVFSVLLSECDDTEEIFLRERLFVYI